MTSDDGSADARLLAAVGAYDGSPGAYGEVLASLAGARVFLALAADAVATEPSGTAGVRQESAARMSLISLVAPDGARALPAFLAGDQVQRWRAQARPVPVEGPLACRTVVADGAAALLLDPSGAAVPVAGAALRELGEGRVPVPGAALSSRRADVELVAGPPAPPGLLAALSRALAGERLAAARLLTGPDGLVLAVTPELAVTPGLAATRQPALDAGALAALAARVRDRLGPDLPATGLDLAVLPGDGPGEPVPLEPRQPARARQLLRRRR